MILENIKNKISRHFDDLDSLEDVEEMYDECIESIGCSGHRGIIDSIEYYKKDIDNLTPSDDLSFDGEFGPTSINTKTKRAPSLVRDIYSEYRSKNPLLKGDETHISMMSTPSERKRFKRKAKQHIKFLSKLRRALREAKDDLDGAYRERSKVKAEEQRTGKRRRFNMYDAMEKTPAEVKNELSTILEESLESDLESNDTEEEEDDEKDPNIMYPYQLVFFLAKKLNDETEDDAYQHLKMSHQEQAEKIERKVHDTYDLDRYKGELDGFLCIDDTDVQYIKSYVREESEILETPQQYRDRKER